MEIVVREGKFDLTLSREHRMFRSDTGCSFDDPELLARLVTSFVEEADVHLAERGTSNEVICAETRALPICRFSLDIRSEFRESLVVLRAKTSKNKEKCNRIRRSVKTEIRCCPARNVIIEYNHWKGGRNLREPETPAGTK